MTNKAFHMPHVYLLAALCITTSLYPVTLAQAPDPMQAEPLAAAMQNAVLSSMPVQPSPEQGAPVDTTQQIPPDAATATPQDPAVQPSPLTDTMVPMDIPVDGFNPQIQGEQVPPETQRAAFPSDPIAPAPMPTQMHVGTILPARGGRGENAKAPYLNFTALDLFPDLEENEPSSLAQVAPPTASNSSVGKPAVCTNNPQLNVYAQGTAMASTCRAYLYTNSARTRWTRCTAWFVSPTHAALAGHCVADGGSGRYYPVRAAGRYGTVCCRTQSNTGPDNCQSAYSFDILSFTATDGWVFSNRLSNDGAVLKLRRPANVASGVGVPLRFGQPNPFCPTGSVLYGGYPGQTTAFTGCNQAWAERYVFATTSVNVQCTTSVGSNSLGYRGSSCGGMSGGPLGNSANTQIGIISTSNTACSSGRSNTFFAAITNGGTTWGVNLAALIARIP